ncbi:MAG: hypothetical protein KAI47_27815 [Deltaproteobacteria bacterium]|nr:hypothetical protein [Deltaproteobacteria bacterium]
MAEEQWDDIDGGWEDLDVDGQKKKRRTRARGNRGKRRATAQTPSLDAAPKKPTPKTRGPKPPKADSAESPRSTERSLRGKPKGKPWLVPALAFVAAIVVFVLFLIASKG